MSILLILAIGLQSAEAQAIEHYKRGVEHRTRREWDKAIAEFTKAIDCDPKFAEIFFSRGAARIETDQVDEAIADFTKAIELKPRFAEAYVSRGVARTSKRRLEEAAADLDKGIEIDPSQSYPFYVRASIRELQKKHAEAIADCTKAIELNPRALSSYRVRARCKLHTKDFDGAWEDATRILERDPKSAEAYVYRGWCKQGKDLPEEAEAEYAKAVELDPEVQVYNVRGNYRKGRGLHKEAIEDFTLALKYRQDPHVALCNRGFARYDLGEWDAALADFRKAMEHREEMPRHSMFEVWLIRTRQGEKAEAMAELKVFMKNEKETDWKKREAPLFAFITGEMSEADYLKSSEKEGKGPSIDALFYAGSKRLFAGDKEGARDLFQRCVDSKLRAHVVDASAAELKRLK